MKIVTVPGANAMDEMRRLLDQRADTGLHPTLFGNKESADAIALDYSWSIDSKKVKQVIKQSFQYNLSLELARFYMAEECDEDDQEIRQAEEAWLMVGGREAVRDNHQDDIEAGQESVLYACMDGDELLETAYVGLWQIPEPWHAFAYLGLGEDPDQIIGGAKHCAIHRHWQERWGAEVVALQENRVECFVKRPPLTREDALILAREQYFYCGDLVSQGAGSVVELAEILLGSRLWFFWWD